MNCVILDTSPVHIGENAFLLIHYREQRESVLLSQSLLKKNVWIGANAVVCGGVTIGEGSVIGAGSVATKDIPPMVVAVGNPCRVIRKITKQDKICPEEQMF